MAEHLDPDVEIIGIVDADYAVEPDFLRDVVGYFADPAVAFVQTPQDCREYEGDPYMTACYDAYNYFFKASMPSDNPPGQPDPGSSPGPSGSPGAPGIGTRTAGTTGPAPTGATPATTPPPAPTTGPAPTTAPPPPTMSPTPAPTAAGTINPPDAGTAVSSGPLVGTWMRRYYDARNERWRGA